MARTDHPGHQIEQWLCQVGHGESSAAMMEKEDVAIGLERFRKVSIELPDILFVSHGDSRLFDLSFPGEALTVKTLGG